MTLFRRGAPLFVQALGLVIVTLVAAQLIAIAVVFNLDRKSVVWERVWTVV